MPEELCQVSPKLHYVSLARTQTPALCRDFTLQTQIFTQKYRSWLRFYSEIQELTQILLRISEEKIGGWRLWYWLNWINHGGTLAQSGTWVSGATLGGFGSWLFPLSIHLFSPARLGSSHREEVWKNWCSFRSTGVLYILLISLEWQRDIHSRRFFSPNLGRRFVTTLYCKKTRSIFFEKRKRSWWRSSYGATGRSARLPWWR